MQEHVHRAGWCEDGSNAQNSSSRNRTEDCTSSISGGNLLSRVTKRCTYHDGERHRSDRTCPQGMDARCGREVGQEDRGGEERKAHGNKPVARVKDKHDGIGQSPQSRPSR